MENISFKALLVTEQAEKQFTKEIVDRKIEDLPEGDVVVQVLYSSLNYKDALSASGHKGITRKFPHTPGIDASGTVAFSENPDFQVGDQVLVIGFDLGMNTPGGYGQYIRVPSEWVMKLPENLSPKEAMIYGTAGLTAGLMIDKLILNGVTPESGEILVTGATGGVGSLAVAILSHLGYQVTVVTGKLNEKDYLEKLGATLVMSREEFAAPPEKPLLKERWGGVIDTVSGETLSTAIKSTKFGGSVTCCGMVTSINLNTTIFPFILRNVNLLGIASSDNPLEKKKEIWEKLSGAWKIPQLNDLYQECQLEELPKFIDDMLNGQTKGRIVVNLG